MIAPSPSDETIDNALDDESPVNVLRQLAATARLLRSSDGRFYAQVPIGGRRETYLVKSAAFRDYLVDTYFRQCRELPSDWAIRRVLGALQAAARFESGTSSVFVRVGHDGNGNSGGSAGSNGNGSAFYLDLGDPSGQAIKIGPEGWAVVDHPPVHFHRPVGLLPLPMPSRAGSIELLRPYVNISEPGFRLLITWMAAALRPAGPYPILAIYGETGTAKTTLSTVVRLLIDPWAAPALAQPRTTRELVVRALNGWLVAHDNISAMPRWLSDGLCMLATAGAFAVHAPLTNTEGSVIHAQRPIMLSGIEEFVGRVDMGDRSLILDLPTIADSKRRTEDELWEAFHRDYPLILGGLLDAVVGGLRELPSVKLTALPRMADFARFAEAVGRSLGWPAGTALSDYNDNRREAAMTHIEDSPLADILLELAPHKVDWVRTASDLLAELTAWAGKRVAASPRWPKSPLALSKELRRIAPQLRFHGISIIFLRTSERRFITIEQTNRPITAASPHVSVSEIESCGDERLDGEKSVTDVTQIPATG